MTRSTMPEFLGVTARRVRAFGFGYVSAIVVGAVLVVVAAINQPYNQNEILQIRPYGSDDIAEITGGTRQPPLGPLLGGMFQHLFGVGQLQQRLVPVLAGIGVLVVMALLLRRMNLGTAGVFGLWILATAPLFVRYSAYTRPYILPMFFMVLFIYAVHRWLDEGRARWLVLSAVAAAALPFSRVPEPMVFLLTAAVVLGFAAWRGHLNRRRARTAAGIALAAFLFVGLPMVRALASSTGAYLDLNPIRLVGRLHARTYEVVHATLPLLGDWLPWWPVTVLVVVAALAVPASRRRLLRWWFALPLLAAPVGFAFVYHYLNKHSLDVLPYRPRAASFFLPIYVLVVAALASSVRRTGARWLRIGVPVLLCAALVGQLPSTARVLVQNEAPDFGQAAQVITEDLPRNAIVLYDNPNAPVPPHMWRHMWLGGRYMGRKPYLIKVPYLQTQAFRLPHSGPVYVLLLDSECGSTVCDYPRRHWDRDVPGWHVQKRFDRFTLYAPDTPVRGRHGAVLTLLRFGKSIGPKLAYPEFFAAANLQVIRGNPERARQIIENMYESAPPEVADQIRHHMEKRRARPGKRPSPYEKVVLNR